MGDLEVDVGPPEGGGAGALGNAAAPNGGGGASVGTPCPETGRGGAASGSGGVSDGTPGPTKGHHVRQQLSSVCSLVIEMAVSMTVNEMAVSIC